MKHILFTNNTLDTLGGSELYIYDLAREFKKRGHEVTCFTLKPGQVSERLARFGVKTTGDLGSIEQPDLIHSHHRLEFKIAAAHFPQTPVVHGSLGPNHPFERPTGGKTIITRHLAVSELVRRMLREAERIPAEKIEVVPNFVDLTRFTAASRIEAKPRRVLLISSYFEQIEFIREACKLTDNLELTWIGSTGKTVWDVGQFIERSDIVIAKGQGALQAMAMGRAVVVYGPKYADGMISPDNFEAMATCNFNGMIKMLNGDSAPEPMDATRLAAEFGKYDRDSAESLMTRVREEYNIERVADRILAVYDLALSEFNRAWAEKPLERAAAVAAELGQYLAFLKQGDTYLENITHQQNIYQEQEKAHRHLEQAYAELTANYGSLHDQYTGINEAYLRLEPAYLELQEAYRYTLDRQTRLEDHLEDMRALLDRVENGRVLKTLGFLKKLPRKLRRLP